MCHKQRIIPGWNNNVKSLYADARAAYLIWLDNGKSNTGLMYDRMISSRKKFKYALRNCKKNQEQDEADALAEALVSDKSAFCYKVKKSSIFSTAETVGGVSGDANIIAMWKNYFCSLLNSVPVNSHQESANKSAIKNGNFDNIHEFTCDPGAIRSLSFELPLNRACGNDNIFAEHIRYAHESIFFH